MGIDRRLFIMAGVGAVTTFNVSKSIVAGFIIFAGCAGFGYWVTKTDPAFLRILLKADRFKARYDAAKQQLPNVEIR
jgi:type IV secretory pathway TrbD component